MVLTIDFVAVRLQIQTRGLLAQVVTCAACLLACASAMRAHCCQWRGLLLLDVVDVLIVYEQVRCVVQQLLAVSALPFPA